MHVAFFSSSPVSWVGVHRPSSSSESIDMPPAPGGEGPSGRGRPLMKEQRSPSAGWGRTGIINSRNTKSHTTLTDPHRHFRPRRALSPRAAAAACASPPSAPCVVAARDTSTTFPATNACYALALPVYPQPPPLPRRQHHSPPTAKLLAHPGRVHVDPKWASLRCWRFSSPSCS
jgi:hypothetical protein